MLCAEQEFLADFSIMEPSDIEDKIYVHDSNNKAVLRVILTNTHDLWPDYSRQFTRVKEYIPKKTKYVDGFGWNCIFLYHSTVLSAASAGEPIMSLPHSYRER